MLPRAALRAALLAAAATAAEAQEDWSGPYVGLALGAVRSTGAAERGAYEGSLITLDVANGLLPDAIGAGDAGALGGVRLGYAAQRGDLVGGIEIGIEAARAHAAAGFSRVDPQENPVFHGMTTVTGYETETGGLATLTLRGGRAWGDTLAYALAGVAAGRVENRFSLRIVEMGYAPPDWIEDGTRVGYIIGAGVERQVTASLSVWAEAAWFDLADATVEATDPATFPGESVDYRFDNAGAAARLGVNFRF